MLKVKLTALGIGVAVAVGVLPMHAIAHPGSHHGMSYGELAQHLATGWHLAVLVAATVLGAAVLALTQRRGAKVPPEMRKPGDRS